MEIEKEEYEVFEPFQKQIKQTTEKIRSALSYEKRKAIGIQLLREIATQIPQSFGVKCLLTKGEEEVCFIDRGETYADTLIFRPSKDRRIFVVGAWGDYTK